MGPADALSWQDDLNTTEDNANTSILPNPMVINSLDLTLARHIKSSSASNPFVLKALAALDEGSPLFTCTSLSDWSFDNGHLYFRNHIFVPSSAHSALLHSIHSPPSLGHMGGLSYQSNLGMGLLVAGSLHLCKAPCHQLSCLSTEQG